MTSTSRRNFLGALALSGATLSGATLSASRALATPAMLDPARIEKETDIACLYHCDFGDPARFSQMLTNINNHLSAYDFDPMKIRIVIVAHGAGIKFFLEDLAGTAWEKEEIDPDIYKRFVGLTKFEVAAYLCRITFTRQKIDPARARRNDFIKLVPSGVATVGKLQARGFGYLKVG